MNTSFFYNHIQINKLDPITKSNPSSSTIHRLHHNQTHKQHMTSKNPPAASAPAPEEDEDDAFLYGSDEKNNENGNENENGDDMNDKEENKDMDDESRSGSDEESDEESDDVWMSFFHFLDRSFGYEQ